MIYILDAHSWIECYIGSAKGILLKKLLANKNHKFITLECTLSELKSYCLRVGIDFNQMFITLKRNSVFLPVMQENWLQAAEIRHEMKKKIKDFGLIDAILIAKQRDLNCSIVSGDPHFKGMKNVVFSGN